MSQPSPAHPASTIVPTVTPVSGHIGARLDQVRLGGELDDASVAVIKQALLDYKVIFFRDQQHLDDTEHERFAQRLGTPVAHPTVPSREGTEFVLDIDSQHGRADSWHTDVTFRASYPAISILRAAVLPPAGGDTVWANTEHAYASLPIPLQRLADSLYGIHTNEYDYAQQRPVAVSDEQLRRYREIFTSTVYQTRHPLVTVHPETGRPSLLLGHFLQRIEGLDAHTSKTLFNLLQSHVTRLEHTVRWQWRPGDVAIWDNRATQHYALNDYGQAHRVVRRVTLRGVPAVDLAGRPSHELEPRAASLQAA